ncbi:MAG: methyltransferase domain-containing protein [Verrucomicrobiota bacterium]
MDWNARYLEGDTPWDKGEAAPPLGEIWERFGSEVWGGGTVLVPGCGLGHDARWLAGKSLEVWGLDVAPLAVERGQELVVGGNPELEVGDFFEAEAGRVTAIFEHTCFCAIEPEERERYAEAARVWLGEGECLVAIFFLTPGNEGKGPPYGVTREELDGLFGEGFELEAEWVPGVGYGGREGRELVRVLKRV